MATEGTVRLVGSSGPGKWPVNKDAALFSTEDLGLLLGGSGYHGSRISGGPGRSGSAPPSMEGSRASLSFLRSHISNNNDKFEGLKEAAMTLPEDQLRAHPAYFAYYCTNVKMNPRLPPPLTSEESHYLSHNASVVGNYFKLSSFDDSSKASSLFVARPVLPTHTEEAEDEKSPRTESIDSMEKNPDGFTVEHELSLQGRHKSLVDLIQEDFPRTPSPVYNAHSHTSSHTTATRVVPGTLNSLKEASLETHKPETGSPTFEGGVHPPEPSLHYIRSMSHSDASTLSAPYSPSSNKTATGHYNAKADSSRINTNSSNSVPLGCVVGSKGDIMEREINKFRISTDNFRSQHTQQYSQHFVQNVLGSSSQAQIGQSQFIPQAGYNLQTVVDHLGQGQLKFPMSEGQPVLQSTAAATAVAAPFYAMAAAYGASYYSNLQSPNLMSSQYNLGGFTVSTPIVPPLLPGFPSQHTAVPVPLSVPLPVDNPANPNFAARASGFSTGGPVISTDMQQFYKAYGQLGISFQPSYTDQLYVPYFQHPAANTYAVGQYDLVTPRGSNVLSPSGGFNPQKVPIPMAYVPELQPQVPRFPGFGLSNARKGGPINSNYYGTSPNIGVIMQYPSSPVTSPVFRGPITAGSSFTGRRNEDVRFPFSSGRGAARGWQGPRGQEKVEDPKTFSFLEELRSNKARGYELSDISGRVVEFSADQHGSRFIQQKLETCSEEEKSLVFMEILPCATSLITDVFGNYVIQKFFEHGSSEQRRELANELAGNILSLSLQMYGCRVIQKALEVIELEQKLQLVQELDGHVMKCVRDQNGNHVIQKFIECVPTEKISFIISAFRGQVASLSTHPYGCRVIQRVLEHCTDESQSQCIVDEVLQSACDLAQNQYGNYVTQHVLERGKPHERSQIISKLAGQVVQMSQHKFASNVIEKCFQCGSSSEKEHLIDEILEQTEGNDNLLMMMKDQYANYVVQKVLDISTGKQHEILLDRIKVHLQALKKYTYGKHIVARVEQLYGEDGQIPDC